MKIEKNLLKKLEEIDRLNKLSDDLMDTDEEASDKAYGQMWDLAKEVADTLVKITKGQINRQVALKMVWSMRPQLVNLCKRFA